MPKFALVLLGAGWLFPAPASALDLVKGRKDLPELVLGDRASSDYAVSQKDHEFEWGKSYRLAITAKGQKEFKFLAPELSGIHG